MSSQPQLITVFGGSGFIGRHVVRALAAHGYRVRVACRRPDLAGHLQPLGNVGQIQLVQANLRFRWSIDRAVVGSNAVINLVGATSESGKQNFESLNVRGAAWVADAAAREGARLVHMSALGADHEAKSDYLASKAKGEMAVLKAVENAVILRPSVVFGQEDRFVNGLASLGRIAPFMPLVNGGRQQIQPVYVGDVAKAVVQAVGGHIHAGVAWELAGPEVMSTKEASLRVLELIERKRGTLGLPLWLLRLTASVAQFLPGKPLTPALLEQLKNDSVASDPDHSLEKMGITPAALGAIVPSYVVRFKKHGEFEANRGL